jgi:tRNA(Arg) A34 adenosine deaminase TadA
MCFGASMWSGISRIVFACAKEKVSPEYYGGNYIVSDINKDLLRSIKIDQLTELEEESLSLVKEWEGNLPK